MKRLYLIGGTMGVGKTTVSQQLKHDLPNSVFLDGDWCWDASPFQVTEETKAMKEGVELIFTKFQKVLQQEGLQAIETEGKDFDVDFCEAIALVPAPSEDLKGKILDCVQTGYMLNDKVIRHAKVVVAQ